MFSLTGLLPQAHALSQRAWASLPKALLDGRAFPPLRLAFVVTHRCNLRCAWCMVTHEGARETWRASGELRPEEIESVTRQTLPSCMITITGGEPFVRADTMEILERVCLLRPVHIVTNGTLVRDEHVEWLASHGARSVITRGVVTIGVSLEGQEELHDKIVRIPGSHAKTLVFIERLLEARRSRGRTFPLLDVKVVLSKDNWQSLPSLRDEMARVGVDLVTVQIQNNQASAYGIPSDDREAHLRVPPPVDEIPFEPLMAMLREVVARGRSSPGRIRFTPPLPLEHLAAHYRGGLVPSMLDCHATWTTIHVGPYGDVFPCFSYPMGSVRSSPLQAVWNAPAYRRFRRALKAAGAFPGCVGCCMASPRSSLDRCPP